MSQTPQNTEEPKILGSFLSILGLISAALYFTGWIYRWIYFSFFKLEVTTFDLPLESFFMVPIQVCLGNFWAFCKTVLAALVTFILIQITFSLIKWISKRKLNFQQSLLHQTIVVAWIFVALLQLARIQAQDDAYRDAVNQTSTLPVITLVTPATNDWVLGRKLDKSTENPQFSKLRIIGDRDRYKNLLGREINDKDNSRVWRLLIARNGYLYLFKALPPNATRAQRPPVIVIKDDDSGDNLLILSPEATKPQSN